MTKSNRLDPSSPSRYQDYSLAKPTESEPLLPPPRSALSRRLRKSQPTKAGPAQVEESPFIHISHQVGGEELNSFQEKVKQGTDYLSRMSQLAYKHLSGRAGSQSRSRSKRTGRQSRFWLTMEQEAYRRVMLPRSGALVFGHSGQGFVLSPDVDLSYEDRETHLLSRRHAVVTGKNGSYTIADLGSQTGVYLNDNRVGLQPSAALQPGDCIQLGQVQFVFEQVSNELLNDATTSPYIDQLLTITALGQQLPLLPASGSILIGRADARLGYQPDIDLGLYGDLTRHVSRRHARIVWKQGVPYLEDLGSGFGTRLRGELLSIGQSARLYPGDQIWLAGCVLAYDIELQAAEFGA